MGRRRTATPRQEIAAELADLRHALRRCDMAGEVVPDADRAAAERRIAWLARHLAEIDIHRRERYPGHDAGTRARHA